MGAEPRLFWRDIETILDHGGATEVVCETVTDRKTALAFCEAWHEVAQGVHVPATLSVSVDPTRVDDDGRPRWRWVAELPDLGDITLGLNCCSGPVPEIRELLARLAERDLPPLLQLSAGVPDAATGRHKFGDPQAWAAAVAELIDGLRVGTVGGCCGTTPQHVEALVAALA